MRHRIELSSDWYVRELGPDQDALACVEDPPCENHRWLRTVVPAQVHDVLLAHGQIADPHIAANAAACAGVGEKDWVYVTNFATPDTSGGPLFLCFDGLDTLATVWLNGVELGRFENMFRRWRLDVTRHLHQEGATNQLVVKFDSVLQAIAAHEQPAEHVGIVRPDKYWRQSMTDFSSYLGARPHFCKVGIHGAVWIDVPEACWIQDAHVRTVLADDQRRADIQVAITLGGGGQSSIAWRLRDPQDAEVAQGFSQDGAFEIGVDSPVLWWPHTHGTPALYTLEVDLLEGSNIVDQRSVRVGIRSVQLQLKTADGEDRFQFVINGRPLWLQGAGMAPFEGMSEIPDRERTTRLLELTRESHMNLLRVWGDASLPEDAFYDLCDEQGILVWHDFMFGNGMYADDDPRFMANIEAEATELVRRLRNHPCILLWVGGNENHMAYDFSFGGYSPLGRSIFEEMLPAVCRAKDPDRCYHPSSPFGVTPADDSLPPNWPLTGDWHDYTTVSYSPAASVPLFASEIGRVSAPSLNSVKRMLPREDLWPQGFEAAVHAPGQPIWPPAWGYHAADGAWEKIGPIERSPDIRNARDLVRALGIAHGDYLYERVTRERRGQPDGAPGDRRALPKGRRCGGNMIWRLNDAWPTIYWSAVDYYLEPKIAYYYLKRAQAPQQLSFEQTADRICVWAVNDASEPLEGVLTVTRMSMDGVPRGALSAEVSVAPGEALRALDLSPLGPISLRHEFLWATLGDLSCTHLLAAERYLALKEATLSLRVTPRGLEISSDVFARQVHLEMDDATGALFADNDFDLAPGHRRTIPIIDTRGGHRLVVRCLNAATVQLSR